jgi:hypothetical protein
MKPLSLHSIERRSIEAMIRDGATAYKRERDLPLLLAVSPHEIRDCSSSGVDHVIERLTKALDCMTRLARMNHWSYDFNRNIGLLAALKAERETLSGKGSVNSNH